MESIKYNQLLINAIKANFGYSPFYVHLKTGKEPLMAKVMFYYKMNKMCPGMYNDAREISLADQYEGLLKDATFRRKLALVDNYIRLMGND